MHETRSLWSVSLAALCIAAAVPATAQDKGGLDLIGPYDVVVGWFKPGIDGWNQRVVSVNAEDPNRVFIGAVDRNDTREGFPMLSADGKVMKEKNTVVRDNNDFAKGDVNNILVLNANGEVIENWSQWNSEISIAPALPSCRMARSTSRTATPTRASSSSTRTASTCWRGVRRAQARASSTWSTPWPSTPTGSMWPTATTIASRSSTYVADANNNRVQKFVPKKNANKAQHIGKELVLKK